MWYSTHHNFCLQSKTISHTSHPSLPAKLVSYLGIESWSSMGQVEILTTVQNPVDAASCGLKVEQLLTH